MWRLWLWAVIVVAAVVGARAEAQTYRCADYISADYFSLAAGTCTPTTKGSTPKPVWRCSPGGQIHAITWVQDIGGSCTGGSNDGTACTASGTCTGGGRCAVLIDVLVDASVNSTDTTDKICAVAYLQASPPGSDWGANDGQDGAGGSDTSAVLSTANLTIRVLIEDVEFWDQANGIECTPANCANAMALVVIERPSVCTDDTPLDVDIHGIGIGCTLLP